MFEEWQERTQNVGVLDKMQGKSFFFFFLGVNLHAC